MLVTFSTNSHQQAAGCIGGDAESLCVLSHIPGAARSRRGAMKHTHSWAQATDDPTAVEFLSPASGFV
jgi:hypothetical protein